jgi:activating signal cointegrator 1
MKALTLWQPWASLVALGLKHVETRSWATKYRGLLAIHAAAADTKMAHCWPAWSALLKHKAHSDALYERGHVLCVVRLLDVVPVERLVGLSPLERSLGDYSPGRFAWILDHQVHVLREPMPYRGRQRLWNLPDFFIDRENNLLLPPRRGPAFVASPDSH